MNIRYNPILMKFELFKNVFEQLQPDILLFDFHEKCWTLEVSIG